MIDRKKTLRTTHKLRSEATDDEERGERYQALKEEISRKGSTPNIMERYGRYGKGKTDKNISKSIYSCSLYMPANPYSLLTVQNRKRVRTETDKA